MLHRGNSNAHTAWTVGGGGGGTPRQRRPAAAPWPSAEQPASQASKRGRLTWARVLLTAAALTLAVVYSLAIFNAGMQAAQHTEAQESSIITPGKRHRKLEHGVQLDKVQAALAAQEQQQQQGAAEGADLAQQQQQQGAAEGADLAQQQQQQQGAAEGADLAQQQQEQQQLEQQQPGAGDSSDGTAQLGVAADAEGEREQHQQQEVESQGDGAAAAAQQATGQGGDGDGALAAAEGAAAAQQHQQHQNGSSDGGVGDGSDSSSSDGVDANSTQRNKSPYHKALEGCQTLACLREAAKQKRFKGQFLFPHFLIIGWQKCATTSLFHHLKDHPAVITPSEKEPEFFSYDCQYNPEACPAEMQKEYIDETLHLDRILRHNLYRLTFEGSTHYAREGHRMAKGLRRVFPWVKLIASMREPISRYLSMLGHNLDKNTYTCLRKRDLFECLELELPWNNYTTPFTTWLEAFPREQIMLLQYESLTAPQYEKQHLTAVKSFLGVDPDLPASAALPHSNTRAARLGQDPEGWPMKRWQYERLVEIVRPDAESIANIVTQHGFGDGAVWMANWEAAWKANLEGCDAEGNCNVH